MTTETMEQLKVRIAMLEAENRDIISKHAKAIKPGLPNHPTYDTQHMVSTKDMPGMIVTAGVLAKAAVADARNIVMMFRLHPIAQSKPNGAKGRGALLYLTGDIKDVLTHIGNFSSSNS